MSEKSLKKLLPWLQNSAINTQVKDHIPLKTAKNLEHWMYQNLKIKKNECQKYKFIISWVAEYEMQLDPCDYPLY